MRTLIALAVGRAIRKLIRVFRHGGGSALPGTIAFKIQPKLFEIAVRKFPLGLVVVSGSSGKSSTTKFLVQILESQGLSVFSNPSTANIKQGLFSAVLQGARGLALPRADIAVIEMDEAYAATIGAPLKPRLSVITNVMDEQLDRFGDSSNVLTALKTLALASRKVLANGNDPSLGDLNSPGTKYFGLSDELAGLEAAPRYSVSDAESVENLDYRVESAEPFVMTVNEESILLDIPDYGLHMSLNFAAAVAAAHELVGPLNLSKLSEASNNLQGVFGRDTVETIGGVPSRILLVQNRESFRLNLLKATKAEQVFMAIGTDVKDPSWLWGVDLTGLPHVDVLTGHHAIPMNYRLESCGVKVERLLPEFENALSEFLSNKPLLTDERVFIVTADTFRRMKRSLELGS
jgi:UDP-N-acetylmuramyl tripeptide synthase